MSPTRIATILSFILIACAGSSEKENEPDAEAKSPPQRPTIHEELPVSDGGGSWAPCDRRRDKIMFKFDGGTFVITVPTLCDPTPYIEKGDPPWQESNEL